MFKPNYTILSSIGLFILLPFILQSNAKTDSNRARIVFYNVENFFDPFVDSASNYNEFTEEGERHWSYTKFRQKKDKIYQLITAVGEWESPALVAFAEIENRYVLEELVNSTPLKEQDYGIIHFESEDERGIDVGAIYLKRLIKPLESSPIRIGFPKDTSDKTRDILYIKSLIFDDTLHLFINHWPSRYGGILETEAHRLAASSILKQKIDSLNTFENQNILVMGDFNDNPEDKSIVNLISGESPSLIKLGLQFKNNLVNGSYKYQSKWENYDQMFCSEYLFAANGNIQLQPNVYTVFDEPFVLEDDQKYQGLKPFRTFIGYNYHGGFSDHLAVYVDIYPSILK